MDRIKWQPVPAEMTVSPERGALKRAINLPLLVLYGLGTIIGAGIYALVGEIAGVAGYAAPLSFVTAALVAGITAASFAELAARFPRAAGAALYVRQGFGSARLARVVGLLVILAGTVSSAALLNAFANHLQIYLDWPRATIIVAMGLVLAGLAAWGIAQSVAVAAAVTLLEIGGLVAIIAAGAPGLASLPERWTEFLPGSGGFGAGAVLLGVPLAFYAFIGFEDMVDIAEEIKDVQVTLPRGILLTMAISTVLYLLLMVTALLAMTPSELAASNAPLVALYQAHTGVSPLVIGLIAMFAIINGALIQIVMASRVLYGLATRGQIPAWLGRVHPRTRTPLLATAVAGTLVVTLALSGGLAGLATTTSMLVLAVFALVNLALWRIKGQSPAPRLVIERRRMLPLTGFFLSTALIVRELVLRAS